MLHCAQIGDSVIEQTKGNEMQLTELKISARNQYRELSAKNPLVCSVKLSSEKAIVETVLHPDQLHQVLLLVQGIVADAAKRNVDEFVSQVTAIEGPKP
jgi:hypothetical protein